MVAVVCVNAGLCLVHKSDGTLTGEGGVRFCFVVDEFPISLFCWVFSVELAEGAVYCICIKRTMWLCKGGAHPQYRVQMDSGTFYAPSELFRKCKNLSWPQTHVFLEYFPGAYLKVQGETELSFACELVSRYHTSVTSSCS
eukprot:1995308-Rhodomonas_salina.1